MAKALKVTVSMPEELLERIDREARAGLAQPCANRRGD
jgi:metal-responsive CopG/Arc/MetJ family transcriptional regulator